VVAAWEKKDLGAFNILLADNLPLRARPATTHQQSTFKAQCWDTQVEFIETLTWSGSHWRERRFCEILCHTKKVKRSGTWSISESRTESWNPLSVISAHNPLSVSSKH